MTDPSGAVIQKARVTVVNQETNAIRETLTNDDGDFTVALLPPGRYRVAVEKQGFRLSVHNDVNLDVDQTARVDFALQVGIVGEELTVTDTPPLVQTDTSTSGQVINGRQVSELPLNERNFLTFALLVPGSQLPARARRTRRKAAPLASTVPASRRTISRSRAWTTTTPTLTSTSSCPRSTPFRNLRCNPATTRPNSAAAAEPR